MATEQRDSVYAQLHMGEPDAYETTGLWILALLKSLSYQIQLSMKKNKTKQHFVCAVTLLIPFRAVL